MQHFLASRQTVDIPVKHLFVEYKSWIGKRKPFLTVRDELATLARQRDDFRRLIEPNKDDVLFPLVTFLDRFDIRTVYPLLLHLLDTGLTDDQWKAVSATLESYLLRRAVCNLTTKNYNRVFLTLTRALRRDGTSTNHIRKFLSELSGDSSEWPLHGRSPRRTHRLISGAPSNFVFADVLRLIEAHGSQLHLVPLPAR